MFGDDPIVEPLASMTLLCTHRPNLGTHSPNLGTRVLSSACDCGAHVKDGAVCRWGACCGHRFDFPGLHDAQGTAQNYLLLSLILSSSQEHPDGATHLFPQFKIPIKGNFQSILKVGAFTCSLELIRESP